MKTVKIKDLEFEEYISQTDIESAVKEIANQINGEFDPKHGNEPPVFLGILDGSFRFLSDLLSHIDIECGMSFLKLSSYEGTETTGKVSQLIGLKEDLQDRSVIIVEDIVDTGITIEYVVQELVNTYNPKEIIIATLLFKPDSYTKDVYIQYTGFNIDNDFVVGYGLDYDGLGRNLNDIYKLKENGT